MVRHGRICGRRHVFTAHGHWREIAVIGLDVMNPMQRRESSHTRVRADCTVALPDIEAGSALIEREPELALLCRRIAEVRRAAASGGVVLLSAEAGGGKTSLLLEAARRAGRDVQWLWGACEPLLSPPPLGALLDLLDHLPLSLAAAVRAGHQTPEVLAGVLAMLRDRGTPA
ncbi:MAG TPA: AAA family ATPase, partial [Burkholderiaceae bacterium]|nr:AAA family ATPase [Burkholderiaceae bacterium]